MEDNQAMGFWQGYSFALNSIMGSGTLVIPWAYSKGGFLLGIFSQVLTSFSSIIVSYMILQSSTRVRSIIQKTSQGYCLVPVSIPQLFKSSNPSSFLYLQRKNQESSQLVPIPINEMEEISLHSLHKPETRYDLTDMASILLGKHTGVLFGLVLIMSLFGCMIALCTIFASSLSSIIPSTLGEPCNIYNSHGEIGTSCWHKYWLFLFILWSVAIITTMLGIKGQQTYQSVLSIMRYVVIIVILSCSGYCLWTGKGMDGKDLDIEVKIWDTGNIGITLPIVFMANYYHSTIPNITEYVGNKKSTVPLIVVAAVLSSTLIFIAIGILVPLACSQVDKMVTMNWIDFSAQHDSNIGLAIMYVVILFPAFIAISNFPIYAVSLADNILAMGHSKINNSETKNFEIYLCRFAVVTIPILTAGVLYDLGFIFDIFGTMFLLEVGVFIPLLALSSKKIITEPGDYDTWFSSSFWPWFIISTYLIIFCLSWYSLLYWAS